MATPANRRPAAQRGGGGTGAEERRETYAVLFAAMNKPFMFRQAQHERGVALVMVLLIVAMATTIAAFIAQQQGFWQRAMENGRDRAQARRIAEAGIDWARAVLADDKAVSRGVDHGKEMWAMKLPAIPVEG